MAECQLHIYPVCSGSDILYVIIWETSQLRNVSSDSKNNSLEDFSSASHLKQLIFH